jgi:hypothetical protein
LPIAKVNVTELRPALPPLIQYEGGDIEEKHSELNVACCVFARGSAKTQEVSKGGGGGVNKFPTPRSDLIMGETLSNEVNFNPLI